MWEIHLNKKHLDNAYWSIYGTIQLIENLDLNCDPNVSKCPEKSGVVYSYIFLMIYVVIGNVLLINLLIAMFSSTYEQVQENADQIWKFNRYKLVYEFVNVPILPPPLSLLSYMAFYLKSFFKMIVNFVCYPKMKKSSSQLTLNGYFHLHLYFKLWNWVLI